MTYSAKSAFIGFDFGTKKIGVAVGQLLTRNARPLATLRYTKAGELPWPQICSLLSRWQPSALIVGVPLNMDGSEQSLTVAARNFANLLATRYQLPVYSHDERLTSVSARSQLFANGGYKALQQGQVDMVAAQLILQDWLWHYPTEK
jgi:putative Holliday junction resolvase